MKFLDRIKMEFGIYNDLVNGKKSKSDETRAAEDNFEKDGINNDTAEDINNTAAQSGETSSSDTTTDETVVNEADMAGLGGHIRDTQPGVINLGFGVTMDTTKLGGGAVDPAILQRAAAMPAANGQGNAYLDHLAAAQAAQQQPNMGIPPMGAGFIPGQIPVQPSTNVAPPPVGHGRHKIDNPANPKPKTEKADADNVNVDLGAVSAPAVNPPKPPKQWPDTNTQLPRAESVEPAQTTPVFDNRALTSKYKYLAEIEKLALECNVQLEMKARLGSDGVTDSGLITCIAYTPESSKPNPYKGFTIDTGCIIDRRAKMFPAILPYGYEDVPAYAVLIPRETQEGTSKSKNVLNEKVFRDLFTGGVEMLKSQKGMYAPSFMELNKNAALITMPTNNMDKETRHKVYDRLMNAMNAGVFTAAKQHEPNARFKFKGYDKKTQSFVLTNAGVPSSYCGPYTATKVVEIDFGADGNTTVNLIG